MLNPLSDFLKTSTQENNGLHVKASKKLETNQPVDLVGPSVLLKPWVTESVSNPSKPFKPESQLKTCWHVVDSHAVWDATVVSHQVPGDTLKTKVWSLDIFLEIRTGANPTPSPHAIITLPVNINLAVNPNQHPNVLNHAIPNQKENMLKIKSQELTHSHFPTTNQRSWLKSSPMDQSKVPSQFMKILSHTRQVCINTLLDLNLVDMLLKLSDGVLKTVSSSGNAQTLGMKIGVTKVSSEF